MDLDDHKTIQSLNERVIVLIWELNKQFGNDAELPEINEHLKRVSKFLHSKILKTFEYENNKI